MMSSCMLPLNSRRLIESKPIVKSTVAGVNPEYVSVALLVPSLKISALLPFALTEISVRDVPSAPALRELMLFAAFPKKEYALLEFALSCQRPKAED